MNDPRNDIVVLRSGNARLAVAPFLGGGVLGYWWEADGVRHDWLIAAREAGIAGFSQLRLASFPLVPYSNRIRDGRFAFQGRVVVEPTAPGTTNAIHGHGWQVPWRIEEREDNHLTIAYEHRPDPAQATWPWRYRAWQSLAVTPRTLTMAMGIESRSATAMPAGLGHHPYFPRTKQSRVTASIKTIWWPEAGDLPVARVLPPEGADPRQGVAVDSVRLDHAYAGWDGSAAIEWPERRARLTMIADPALATLVIYSPSDAPYFCVEPVSHCVDAFNLADGGMAQTGMRVLAPGETWVAAVRFEPEMLG